MTPQDVHNKLEQLRAILAGLDATVDVLSEAGMCSGVQYWRDDGQADVKLLYCNHSIDAVCPIHGKPAPGKRLRIYVGKDEFRQAGAIASIERYRAARNLRYTIGKIERFLDVAQRRLEDIGYEADNYIKRYEVQDQE